MEKRKFGEIEVSDIGLGCMAFLMLMDSAKVKKKILG